MDNWNGMTEPLDVGDHVRIVKCTDTPEFVGIVTEVILVIPAGTTVNYKKNPTGKYVLKEKGYVVRHPPDSSWGRNRLYKLPPDFFDVLMDADMGAPENRKRLQKTDS